MGSGSWEQSEPALRSERSGKAAGPAASARATASTARESFPASWLMSTFGDDLYAAMEQLAPHRAVLVERLQGVIPESIRISMKHAIGDWEAMETLFRQLSSPTPLLRQNMEHFVQDLPKLQKQLRSAKNERSGTSASGICAASIFPRPAVCEGRDALLAMLSDLVTGGLRNERDEMLHSAILHGVGGIGKSTVALQLLRTPSAVAHFGTRRFFVGCENLHDLDDLLGRLISQLAIDSRGQDVQSAVLGFGRSAPALLVLDNFEDLCSDGAPVDGIEDFLSVLSEGTDGTDGFNLVVTKRGSSGLRIPRSCSYSVGALGADAATNAFVRHADSNAVGLNADPNFRALVEGLDGYPLAIMLLARHFDPAAGITAHQLSKTYKQRHDECLRRGLANTRLTSLQVSAELSLNSRIMSVVGAKDLCYLLSQLPDGADDLIIQDFLRRRGSHLGSEPPDIVLAKGAVVGAGLASLSHRFLLRMLMPLREYISNKVDFSDDLRLDARSAIVEHTDLLVEMSGHRWQQKSGQMSVALRVFVTSQLGNLGHSIGLALESDGANEARKAIQQSPALTEFIRTTVPFVPRFMSAAVARARSCGYVEGEASCLHALGQLHVHMDNVADAFSNFERAVNLWVQLGNGLREAQLLQALGRLHGRKGDFSRARALFESALRLHTKVDNRFGHAEALADLGSLAIREGNLAAASEYLHEAGDIRHEAGDRLGEANSRKSLGHLARLQGDLAGARRYLDAALGLYKVIDSRIGEAQTLEQLGEVGVASGDASSAQWHFGQALALHQANQDRSGEASTLQSLADLALRLGQPEEAQRCLSQAVTLFREVSSPFGEADAFAGLGIGALMQGQVDDAYRHMRRAAEMYAELGRGPQAEMLQLLGALDTRREDPSVARSNLSAALALFEEEGNAEQVAATRALLQEVENRTNQSRGSFDRLRRLALSVTGALRRRDPSKQDGGPVNAPAIQVGRPSPGPSGAFIGKGKQKLVEAMLELQSAT